MSTDYNSFGRQLTTAEIEAKEHRDCVGGLWEEMGLLQLHFLQEQGLTPHHDLVDVGCGALRAGIHFMRYLESGRYHGLDRNASLIEAGKSEMREVGLAGKQPRLLVNPKFEACLFGKSFDYAIAQSVFTHLPVNHVVRCLSEMRKVLKPAGVFYATFFESPRSGCIEPLVHPFGVVTHYDADPFHYSLEEMQWMAKVADMQVSYVGEWGHPRNQKMLAFKTG